MTPEDISALPPAAFDRARYLRVIRFFAGAVAQFIVWEIVLRRFLGRRFVARSQQARWQRVARRFRALAVEMGGVLIKLGQFLSVRVDMLPPSVTSELAGLQDEVPPESLDDVLAVIAAEYGRPVDTVFTALSPTPEAAASLAQVHCARLSPTASSTAPTDTDVIVKVQRPNIATLVETDLRAIATAAGWLKHYPPIRRRVDMDLLYGEFAATTRRELDFIAEAEHARRFAADFAAEPGVRVPRVYDDVSTRRVLVMEDVAGIKVDDLEALAAAGIRRPAVARRLFDTYMEQFFVHNFVHADPHPGNLFVRPLGEPATRDETGGRPFQLAFVDFGMVATVPERVRTHFRDFLIGFATQDTARMVRAYQGAGLLLPGADLKRLEEVEGELMARYSGLTLRQARNRAMSEWQGLAREYRDLLFEMPFQVPTDLLFIGRALALLVGMATTLDPDFDPWQAIQPFATEAATGEVRRDWREYLQEGVRAAQLLLSLPGHADSFFRQASQGNLAVRTTWAPDAVRTVRRVEAAINRLAWAVVFAALLLSGIAIYLVDGAAPPAYALFALAALALLISATR
ncbi:MAG: AarF/ABC1/UbiB kinase family protein [Anaerolineae bacterium]|nr:AarF/ABC1/UbiB kinase family protein [Anaerolineae bacterium]